MRPRILIPAVLALGALALAAAGCGGASDTNGERERRARTARPSCRSSPTPPPRSSTTRRSPPSRRPPPARTSASTQSYGASGDQSRAVAGGLAADVVEFSLAPDVDAPRQGRPRRAGLERQRRTRASSPTRSSRSSSARATRRASTTGATCSSPASRSSRPTRSPRARRSGTCSAPTSTAGCRSSSELLDRARQGPAQERPRRAADVHLGPGRRADLLRERGDHRPAEGRERRLRRPRATTS